MRKVIISFIVILFSALQMKAGDWYFDADNPVSTGGIVYLLDRDARVAQCYTAVDQSATTLTVPEFVTIDGVTYRVASVAGMGFMESAVTDITFESRQIEFGPYVFFHGVTIRLASAVPPVLDGPIAIDIETYSMPLVTLIVPKGSEKDYVRHEYWSQCLIMGGDEPLSLTAHTQRVGTLIDLLRQQNDLYQLASSLKVTGPLSDDDLTMIGDSLPMLFTLDLSEADVRSIPRSAFRNSKLKEVMLPPTCAKIGEMAFYQSPLLESVSMPEGVESIGDEAFYFCMNLSDIVLPSTIHALGSCFGYVNLGDTKPITITLNSMFPPEASDVSGGIITGMGFDCTVRVPAMSLDYYKNDRNWQIHTLEAIDAVPENIMVYRDYDLSTDMLPQDYSPQIKMGVTDTYAYDEYGTLKLVGNRALHASSLQMKESIYDDRAYSDKWGNQLLVNAPMTADDISIDIDYRGDYWYFLSFPFDVNISDIVTDSKTTHWIVRRYSSENRAIGRGDQWIDMPWNGTLKAGEGYILYGTSAFTSDIEDMNNDKLALTVKAADTEARNNMFAQTDVSVPLKSYRSDFGHNKDWNFVGNPYPCDYDTRCLEQTMPFIVWNIIDQNYYSYSPIDDDKVLSPFEPFFVQKPDGVDAITFGQDGRVGNDYNSNAAGTLRQTERRQKFASPRTLINLTLTCGEQADRTRLVINANADCRYETECDAAKFFSPDAAVPQIYTFIADAPCAINERQLADGIIPLGVRLADGSKYTIALTQPTDGMAVVLEDRASGKFFDLTDGKAYTFTGNVGRNDSRFRLHLGDGALTVSELQADGGSNAARYDLSGRAVNVPAKGQVTISNGKKNLTAQ